MQTGHIDSIGKAHARLQAEARETRVRAFWRVIGAIVFGVLVLTGVYYQGLACLQGYCG